MSWRFLVQFIFLITITVVVYVASFFGDNLNLVTLLALAAAIICWIMTSPKARIIIEESFKHPLSSSDLETRDGKLHAKRRSRA